MSFEELLEEDARAQSAKYRVPAELEADFTPTEIEEATFLFDRLDADDSGAIDFEEMHAAFEEMEEKISDDELEKLIDEVDEDGNGEVDFQEFLHLLSKFKKGNSKFQKMAKLFDGLNLTPLAILGLECERRHLKLEFKLVEIREATSMHPTQFIMNAEISGLFREMQKDGSITTVNEIRKFQGIGKSTRVAKFNAATTALSRLREHVPGIDFEPGKIPDEWQSWFEENVNRGVDEIKLLEKLSLKGFTPAKNTLFMQKLSLRMSMKELRENCPSLRPLKDGRELPEEWKEWARSQMRRGIHGKVTLQMLVENGFNPDKDPHFSSLLADDKGGAFSDEVDPRSVDFWSCAAAGEVSELRRYIAGGQDPNEVKAIRGHATSALTLAITNDKVEAVDFLIESGADVNMRDSYGRTSIIIAAQRGNVDVVKVLIRNGVQVVIQDRYGDSPLHTGAGFGCDKVVGFLLDWYNERLRRIVSGKDGMEGVETFRSIAESVFEEIIETRKPRFGPHKFSKVWMGTALQNFCSRCSGQNFEAVVHGGTANIPTPKSMLRTPKTPKTPKLERKLTMAEANSRDPVIDFVEDEDPQGPFVFWMPSRQIINTIVNRFDASPDEEFFEFDEFAYMLERCLYQGWVNSKNGIGRTPLMCCVSSSQSELTSAHEETIAIFVNEHGAEVIFHDNNSMTVIEMMEAHLRTFDEEFLQVIKDEDAKWELVAAKQDQSAGEPLMHDPLYLILQKAGEIHLRWRKLLRESHRLRLVGEISEMRHEKTGQIFYCNQEGECEWSKPLTVMDADHELYGWAQIKCGSERIHAHENWDVYVHKESGQLLYFDFERGESQWARPDNMKGLVSPLHDPNAAKEEVSIGFWSKWRIHDSNRVYFRNSKKGGVCQFERPLEWSSCADKSDISPSMIKEDWATIRASSKLLRNFPGLRFEEHQDRSTLNYFYWHLDEERGQWSRPFEVLEFEQRRLIFDTLREREGGRERKKLKVGMGVLDDESGIKWFEETDVFVDKHGDGGLKQMQYFVGEVEKKCIFAQGRKPPPFARIEEERLEERRLAKERGKPKPLKRQSTVFHLTQQILKTKVQSVGRDLQRIYIMLRAAEERMSEGYVLCNWGCKDWIDPFTVKAHHNSQCRRRQVPCERHCGVVLRAEQWAKVKGIHDRLECIKREVPCGNLCGEMIPFENLEIHMLQDCLKRSLPPLSCVHGCDWTISGGLEDEENMKWEAAQHEAHACPLRIVLCDWRGCMAEFPAWERAAHRSEHLKKMGIFTWTTAGTHTWKVPRKCRRLLVQVWGGGGGSGILKDRRGGDGGGGGFVEAELKVHPQEELIVVVGAGGQTRDDEKPEDQLEDDDAFERIAQGGYPGGGDGISNNFIFACGGGGGYSAIIRQGAFGEELLVLAGGGGGGGTREGLPGGDEITTRTIDFDGMARTGAPGTQNAGGAAGEIPPGLRSGTPGGAYQGGRGAQFGGGGGGGLFGGGGGGFTPGVVGGGGGGSSYVNEENTFNSRKLSGKGYKPGGMEIDLPGATGVGDWDFLDRFAGFGGCSTKESVQSGTSGAIRVRLPKYYQTSIPERRIRCETRGRILTDEEARQEEELRDFSSSLHQLESFAASNQDDRTSLSSKTTEDGEEELDLRILKGLEGESKAEKSLQELLIPGVKVLAFYRGSIQNPEFNGVIADVNLDGTYEIEYDDGDVDHSIPIDAIRIPKT